MAKPIKKNKITTNGLYCEKHKKKKEKVKEKPRANETTQKKGSRRPCKLSENEG